MTASKRTQAIAVALVFLSIIGGSIYQLATTGDTFWLWPLGASIVLFFITAGVAGS